MKNFFVFFVIFLFFFGCNSKKDNSLVKDNGKEEIHTFIEKDLPTNGGEMPNAPKYLENIDVLQNNYTNVNRTVLKSELSGVWYVDKKSDMTEGDGFGSGVWFYPFTVSWGDATVHRGCLLIDFEVVPSYTIYFGIDHHIATMSSLVKENDNNYLLTVLLDYEQKYEEYRINVISKNSIRISELIPNNNFAIPWTGQILYKNDLPPDDYVFPATHFTTDNLRLRDRPDLNGKLITTLSKNTRVKLIGFIKDDTIDDKTGDWVKIVSENGYMGFCFSGYLHE